ncbi:hypothetical protein CBR_g49427 [Chara braunii]|uniref:STI1 domain-containing protein n=2 Tax=Streptophytina TaxID=131221 RepID=A0A388M4X4_CHABU|nr:hypothetical protein CBR_g49427 [Chara braunii]|eukprot:GBG89638.1 hypothetical protein CBR_g49427 [Chara braunii]
MSSACSQAIGAPAVGPCHVARHGSCTSTSSIDGRSRSGAFLSAWLPRGGCIAAAGSPVPSHVHCSSLALTCPRFLAGRCSSGSGSSMLVRRSELRSATWRPNQSTRGRKKRSMGGNVEMSAYSKSDDSTNAAVAVGRRMRGGESGTVFVSASSGSESRARNGVTSTTTSVATPAGGSVPSTTSSPYPGSPLLWVGVGVAISVIFHRPSGCEGRWNFSMGRLLKNSERMTKNGSKYMYVIDGLLKNPMKNSVAVATGPYIFEEVRVIPSETPFCKICFTHGHLILHGRCLTRVETLQELHDREVRSMMDPILQSNPELECKAWRDLELRMDETLLKDARVSTQGVGEQTSARAAGPSNRRRARRGGGHWRNVPWEGCVDDPMQTDEPYWLFGTDRKRKGEQPGEDEERSSKMGGLEQPARGGEHDAREERMGTDKEGAVEEPETGGSKRKNEAVFEGGDGMGGEDDNDEEVKGEGQGVETGRVDLGSSLAMGDREAGKKEGEGKLEEMTDKQDAGGGLQQGGPSETTGGSGAKKEGKEKGEEAVDDMGQATEISKGRSDRVGEGGGMKKNLHWIAKEVEKRSAELQRAAMQQILKSMTGGPPGTSAPPFGMPPFPMPPSSPLGTPPPAFTPPASFPPPPTYTTESSPSSTTSTAGADDSSVSAQAHEASPVAAVQRKPAFTDVSPDAMGWEGGSKPAEEGKGPFFHDAEVVDSNASSSGTGSSQTGGGAAAGAKESVFTVEALEKMMEDPMVQKMVYPYLPEEMRNPATFKWMLQNPQYRQQLQEMLGNMGGDAAWDGRMADMMKNFNLSSNEVKQQFDQIGMKPEDVISKIMANPDIAVAFQSPKVQAAIMDCSQNPLNISKYQNDRERLMCRRVGCISAKARRLFEYSACLFNDASIGGYAGRGSGYLALLFTCYSVRRADCFAEVNVH